jgi:hypothetical protein
MTKMRFSQTSIRSTSPAYDVLRDVRHAEHPDAATPMRVASRPLIASARRGLGRPEPRPVRLPVTATPAIRRSAAAHQERHASRCGPPARAGDDRLIDLQARRWLHRTISRSINTGKPTIISAISAPSSHPSWRVRPRARAQHRDPVGVGTLLSVTDEHDRLPQRAAAAG